KNLRRGYFCHRKGHNRFSDISVETSEPRNGLSSEVWKRNGYRNYQSRTNFHLNVTTCRNDFFSGSGNSISDASMRLDPRFVKRERFLTKSGEFTMSKNYFIVSS